MTERTRMTWRVEGVVPAETNGRPWNRNINLQVIAGSLEECVEAVRAKHPDIKLVKVFMDRHLDAVIVAGEA